MQSSNRTTLLDIIIKTNLPIAEPIKTAPHPVALVSNKNLSLFQYSIEFPMNTFLKELKCRKKYLYNKYKALNIIRTNTTKEKR